jgi:hypothetical protein
MSTIGSRSWLDGLGFGDWVPVRYLLETGWSEYAKRVSLQEPGLYAVTRDATSKPTEEELFTATHIGLAGEVFAEVPNKSKLGQWRRKWWAIEELQTRWLPTVDLLYLGKSNPKLKVRVGQLRRFAVGGLGHTGRQVLWQLRSYADRLEIGVLPTSRFPDALPSAPRSAEKHLLAEFRSHHGVLPYANIIG